MYEERGGVDGADGGGADGGGGRGEAGVVGRGGDSVLGDSVPVAVPPAGSPVAVPREIVAKKSG